MAKFVFAKFKINNDFYDWEQSFYSNQPMARDAGILRLFHAKQGAVMCGWLLLCKVFFD